MIIHPANSRPPEAGSPDYFTGDVAMTPLTRAPAPARLRGVSVSFQPGARTAWHTHPLGQTLIVTTGEGRVQRENGPIEIIKTGDVIWFEPNERHWHGAAPNAAMTHIALQEALDGNAVTWETHVTDGEYEGAQG